MYKPFIIGICGGSGSGKTSLIRHLRETFTTNQLCIVSLDDYYRSREEQKIDDQGVTNFDLPKSIDKKAFINDVKQLMEGSSVSKTEYTFNNELTTPRALVFEPAPIIILEGLFIFHFKKVKRMLDLKIYVHAKENLKVIRRIRRDQSERNYPIDDVLYRYQYHVLPTFEKYIAPHIEDADIVVNNNHSFDMGLEVIEGFLHRKLQVLENR